MRNSSIPVKVVSSGERDTVLHGAAMEVHTSLDEDRRKFLECRVED